MTNPQRLTDRPHIDVLALGEEGRGSANDVKFLDRSIQLCPHDFPFSGWYGMNDAVGTLKNPADGVVRRHPAIAGSGETGVKS